eukprot:TRINITY_DN17197_c0_g1_i1.p1 TRINITY_DN17197_c0_g1~~TRINITY_DN17197_c0_g1_i1.p1  ORF type:complete len:112 (+),score=19.97 TRINITY_DN17197_c0_g1_i1:82-417(+)
MNGQRATAFGDIPVSTFFAVVESECVGCKGAVRKEMEVEVNKQEQLGRAQYECDKCKCKNKMVIEAVTCRLLYDAYNEKRRLEANKKNGFLLMCCCCVAGTAITVAATTSQ